MSFVDVAVVRSVMGLSGSQAQCVYREKEEKRAINPGRVFSSTGEAARIMQTFMV